MDCQHKILEQRGPASNLAEGLEMSHLGTGWAGGQICLDSGDVGQGYDPPQTPQEYSSQTRGCNEYNSFHENFSNRRYVGILSPYGNLSHKITYRGEHGHGGRKKIDQGRVAAG